MPAWLSLVALLPLCGGSDTPAPRREVVVVTGTYEPVPLEEADRAVRAIALDAQMRLLTASVADFLRLDASLDLRARAPNGVQGDLSIRGAGFGQTLVLVDGMRLNDAQSGHHNLDIPFPPEALERVEVLKGSGSAYYGSDAVGGVVNLITRVPEEAELRLRVGAGSFGGNQQSGTAGVVWGALSQQFSFARDFSSGFTADRDYRNLSLASATRLRSRLGNTSVLLAGTDRPFGADQFYGDFNSWERTRTWFGSVRQSFGEHTEAAFAYRRHTDLFVLYRDRPEVFTNRHATDSEQAALRRRETPGRNVVVSYGGEWYQDAIRSTNLGDHARQRGAVYAALDARAVRRFSFSAAAREEFYGGLRQFSPTAAAGLWASRHLKLRAAASHAFRVPSYTELYYQDPANLGSPDLRPERAWSYEAGADWYAGGGRIHGEFTVFERRERDGIDYIRRSPLDIWRAANFNRLDFTGLEGAFTVKAGRGQLVELGYTGLRGAQEAAASVYSKYVFNYPTHDGTVAWKGTLGGVVVRTRAGVVARRARSPYAVWDAAAAWTRWRVRPYLQWSNLTGTSYQEILGVLMPGRAVMGGMELVVLGPR